MMSRFPSALRIGLAAALVAAVPRGGRAVGAEIPAPSCTTAALSRARREAATLRAAGNPTAAWERLAPFTELGCLDAPPGPDLAAREGLREAAWLVNDAYAHTTDPRFRSATAGREHCADLLGPLVGDAFRIPAWMTPALRAATVANLKECASHCVPAACTLFNANVWDAFVSERRAFTAPRCTGAAGLRLDAARCLDLQPGKAGFDFSWSGLDGIGDMEVPPRMAGEYCPALNLRRAGTASATRLTLPDASALRDTSLCCGSFTVAAKRGSAQFMISSRGPIRDCWGGTAQRAVEEIYGLEPGSDRPVLIRSNSRGLH